jgi:hypothetical protein
MPTLLTTQGDCDDQTKELIKYVPESAQCSALQIADTTITALSYVPIKFVHLSIFGKNDYNFKVLKIVIG